MHQRKAFHSAQSDKTSAIHDVQDGSDEDDEDAPIISEYVETQASGSSAELYKENAHSS